MTHFEICLEEIKTNGYGIGVEKYTTGTIIYSLMKVTDEKNRTVRYELAYNVAKMLIKEGAKIVYKRNNCHALNFTPERLPKNYLRYNVA